MLIQVTKFHRSLCQFQRFLYQSFSVNSIGSSENLEKTIKAAVEAKDYEKIPDLLTPSKFLNPNPFSFLCTFTQNLRLQIIDEMLQSFIPLRPRSKLQAAYACLLSHTLQSSHPLPLGLAILQQTLRSGCMPVSQTHVFISSAWLDQRCQFHSVTRILLGMQSIGYNPDCVTCNYVLQSLCAVDQLKEAVKLLKGMSGAGCIPDLESYGTVIGAMCRMRMTSEALDLMQHMVLKIGLTPPQGTVVKLMAALRANREIWRAVEIIEFLERAGHPVGFESYELLIKGCLERGEYVLAGKVVMGMTERGFIPYIKVRHKIIECLASIGELKLASAIRQRFAAMRS